MKVIPFMRCSTSSLDVADMSTLFTALVLMSSNVFSFGMSNAFAAFSICRSSAKTGMDTDASWLVVKRGSYSWGVGLRTSFALGRDFRFLITWRGIVKYEKRILDCKLQDCKIKLTPIHILDTLGALLGHIDDVFSMNVHFCFRIQLHLQKLVLCPPFRTFFPYPDVGRRGVVINLLGRHPRRGYVRTLRARRRRSMFDV